MHILFPLIWDIKQVLLCKFVPKWFDTNGTLGENLAIFSEENQVLAEDLVAEVIKLYNSWPGRSSEDVDPFTIVSRANKPEYSLWFGWEPEILTQSLFVDYLFMKASEEIVEILRPILIESIDHILSGKKYPRKDVLFNLTGMCLHLMQRQGTKIPYPEVVRDFERETYLKDLIRVMYDTTVRKWPSFSGNIACPFPSTSYITGSPVMHHALIAPNFWDGPDGISRYDFLRFLRDELLQNRISG